MCSGTFGVTTECIDTLACRVFMTSAPVVATSPGLVGGGSSEKIAVAYGLLFSVWGPAWEPWSNDFISILAPVPFRGIRSLTSRGIFCLGLCPVSSVSVVEEALLLGLGCCRREALLLSMCVRWRGMEALLWAGFSLSKGRPLPFHNSNC